MVGRIPGTVLGAALVSAVAVDTMTLLVGISLLLTVARSTLMPEVRSRAPAQLAVGMASGLMRTVASLGGPIVGLALQSRPDARVVLRDAHDLAVECGAVVVASKAREELGASRARPIPCGRSRSAVADPEPRAAELAAAGRRDQEIARHRHVSQKTVEVPSPAPTTSWGIPTAASVPRRSRGSSPTRAELAPGRGGAGPRSVALRPDLRQVVRMSVVVDRGLRGA